MAHADRERLDTLLVRKELAPSRSKARDLIKRGMVMVAGEPAAKAGLLVSSDADISFTDNTEIYVSRGAHKLCAALEAFSFDPKGRVALDIGASTGGFAEVLLHGGARRIYAVDVGHGQLHERLKRERKVVSLEGRDARTLTEADIPEPVDAITADLSFISLAKALEVPLSFAISGCWLVALIKPQFEAGRETIGSGGIVRDAAARKKAATDVRTWLDARPGWRVVDVIPSPVRGQKGNEEFLLGAVNE